MLQKNVCWRVELLGVGVGMLLAGAVLTGGTRAWAQPAPAGEAKQASKEPGKEPEKDGAKDGAKAEGEPDKPVVLKALPTNIQISGNVQFNENGVMNGQSTYFNVGFFLQPPGNMPIRSIRNVKVQKLVTDSGEDLTQGLRDQSGESFQMPDDLFLAPGQDRNRMRGRRQMYLNPPFPKKPCRKIAKLQGTADIELAQGPLKRVNIGKVSDVDGKRIKIEGVDDAWIQFSLGDEGNQRRMQVTSNASTLGKIARMYFFNGEGTLIQNQGYSSGYSGQGNGTVNLGLYGQFPDTTTAVLIIYGKSKSMSVTFEGTDFPMPSIFAEGSDLFDMVLKPEAIEEGFALADIAPKPVRGGDKVDKAAPKKPVVKPVDPVGDIAGGVPSDISKIQEATFTQEDAPPDPNRPNRKPKPAVKKEPAAGAVVVPGAARVVGAVEAAVEKAKADAEAANKAAAEDEAKAKKGAAPAK